MGAEAVEGVTYICIYVMYMYMYILKENGIVVVFIGRAGACDCWASPTAFGHGDRGSRGGDIYMYIYCVYVFAY